MKCDACGAESDFEAAFIKERRSFRSGERTVCPACWRRRRYALEGWYQVAVVLGGMAGYLLLWLNPWSGLGHFLTILFLIDLFLVLSIVPHELGHALVGRLLGWRVFAVVIGVGKQIFLQLLARENLQKGARYIILNNIAYVDALLEDPALLPEADAYSKEAYFAAPAIPSIVGTRGTVLVAMGDFAAGIKLLKDSFAQGWTPRSKAENACHIAVANIRMGQRTEAEKYLKLARQFDAHCRLIDRAEVEFQQQSSKLT